MLYLGFSGNVKPTSAIGLELFYFAIAIRQRRRDYNLKIRYVVNIIDCHFPLHTWIYDDFFFMMIKGEEEVKVVKSI